jgi:hypothetical protein
VGCVSHQTQSSSRVIVIDEVSPVGLRPFIPAQPELHASPFLKKKNTLHIQYLGWYEVELAFLYSSHFTIVYADRIVDRCAGSLTVSPPMPALTLCLFQRQQATSPMNERR